MLAICVYVLQTTANTFRAGWDEQTLPLDTPNLSSILSRGSINNLLNGWVKWKWIHWQNVPTWTFCDFGIFSVADGTSHSWRWQEMKSCLGRRPPTYTCSLGEAWGFKQIQNLLLRWATGCGIQRKQPWPLPHFLFPENAGWPGVSANSPGHGVHCPQAKHWIQGDQNSPQGYGKRTGSHSPISKTLGSGGLQN